MYSNGDLILFPGLDFIATNILLEISLSDASVG